MLRGLPWAAMLLVAPALVPSVARADESLQVTGSITYTWQGDPARGCAAVGVCDVSGALIVQVAGSGSVTKLGPREQVLNLDNQSATVRVLTGSGSAATECLDVPASVGGPGLFVTRGAHGRLRAGFQPPLSSGRCAGPLAADLGRLSLPVRQSGGKRPSFDLRTNRTFTAGPFSGRLLSTVRMRPPGPKGVLGGTYSQTSTGPPGAPTLLFEHVTLRYRVRVLGSTLGVSFAGAPDSLCAGLGSCAESGTLALAVASSPRTLTLVASRQVKRRVGAHQAIEDLRRGRLGLPTGAFALRARVSETLVAADGSRCQSTAAGQRTAAVFGLGPAIGGVQRGIALVESPDSAEWRTYCPGPLDSDIFGESGRLADGSVSLAQLLRRQPAVLSLTSSGSFTGGGYDGSRSGTLELSLTLVGVRGGTDRETL